MADQGMRTGWGSSVTHKRTRDSQDDVVVIDSDDEDVENFNPRQKSRPAGTTDFVRIHGVDLIMLQPPAGFKSSQNGSDVKPDMAWLQRRPIGSPGGGAAVEPSVRQRGGGALQKRLEQEDREEEHEDTAGEDDDSTQGPPESEEELLGAAMQGVTNANASGEANAAPETQAEAMDDIFSTANHMPASVSAGLIEAITIIRDAIRKHGSDSDGAKAVLSQRVEVLSIMLEPLYPSGQDRGALAKLLEALVHFASNETEALVTEVTNGLEELHDKLQLQIDIPPELHSASLAPAARSQSPKRAMVHVHMRGSGDGQKPEDIFQEQLIKCTKLVQAYNIEEGKTENLEKHGVKCRHWCQQAMEVVELKLEALKKKHADHMQDEVDARKALLDKDLEFKARFSEVNPSRDLRQLMSNSDGELEFISRLLDATTAAPDLLQERAEKRDTLQRREHELRMAEHRAIIMEAFVAVVHKVMSAGDKLAEFKLKKAMEAVNSGKAQLAGELKQNVAEAAVKLQNVIEFHELRKKKAEENIQKKEADIREQKAIFGSEVPAHMRDLELGMNQLRNVANKSESIITAAFHQNSDFHERVEEMLPPALARELTDLFHKNMACNSSLVDYIPAHGTQMSHGLVLTNGPSSSSQLRPERPHYQPAADSKPAAKPTKPAAAKQAKPAAKPQAQGGARAAGGKDEKSCIIC